jgi:hypothetical protein
MTWRTMDRHTPPATLSTPFSKPRFLSQTAASYDVAGSIWRALGVDSLLLRGPGRAVQVDPIKAKLTLPGIERLKLKL